MTLYLKLSRLLTKQNVQDILLAGGGVLPKLDKNELEKAGITGNFGLGSSLDTIIEHIVKNVKKN